jgi:hypothetical protein
MKMKQTKKDTDAGAYENNPPAVVVVRLAKDVQAMMALAKKAGFGTSWAKILNRAARHRLQQEFLTKRVQNIQGKMGDARIPIS